ncbi:hypothetical protein JTB14_008216 [Gonioctena quinquepunctata]|nr:hypothetical protein JTB14_008216 [Gonioctena quinquepunctata]
MDITKLCFVCEKTSSVGATKAWKLLLDPSRLRKLLIRQLLAAPLDIVEKNNEEDDDNLEDLEHADEEMVESEYIVKPGYLQVIRGIFGDGSDDTEQSKKIPTDQQPSTSNCQPSRKRRKRK